MTKILQKEIAFNGRLRTNVDGASIGPNDFQILQNLRPTETGIRGVAGHTKINTTTLGQSIVNGIHFRKNKPSESHVVVDGVDNKCYPNTTAIPNAGDFSATSLYATAGTQVGRYAIAPTGLLARCTGNLSLLYGGTKHPCYAFIDNPTTDEVFDYSDQVSNTLTTTDQIATIHDSSNTSCSYIGSPLPIAGFYLDMNTANNVATTMTVSYWSGTAWVNVSSQSDGTAAGGISMAQDGWVTFTDTQTVAKQTVIEKQMAFWYKVVLAAASTFDGVPKINTVYLSIPMQPAQDIWDGDLVPAASFTQFSGAGSYLRDFTSYVLDEYMGIYGTDVQTYGIVGGTWMDSNGYLTVGFQNPVRGVSFSIPGTQPGYVLNNNSAASIDYLAYWDGDSWVDIVSTVTDGTKTGTASMNKTGWVTWEPPADNVEKPSTGLPAHKSLVSIQTNTLSEVSKNFPLYYYRISWGASLDTNTVVYHVGGIPKPKAIKGSSFPVQHADRLFLCDFLNEDRNAAMYSSAGSANIFGGKDADKIYFGGDEALVSGVSIYNRFGSTESNLLVLCKRGETWILSGDDPEKWVKFRISDTIGCIAPQTMWAVNVPSKEMTPGVSSNAAIWLTTKGVVLFSGGSFTFISEDIGNLFDPQRDEYIGDEVLATCTGFVDPKRNEYHLIVPASKEYVYSFQYGKWFQIVRGTKLNGGFPTQNTNGINFVYGYDSSGYMHRLEYSQDFSGTDIAHVWQTGDFALPDGSIMEKSRIDWGKLVARAKTENVTITVTYYDDTGTSAYTTKTASPVNTGYRLMNAKLHKLDKQSVFHSLKFAISTTAETIGFEPMYLGLRYTVFPDEVS